MQLERAMFTAKLPSNRIEIAEIAITKLKIHFCDRSFSPLDTFNLKLELYSFVLAHTTCFGAKYCSRFLEKDPCSSGTSKD